MRGKVVDGDEITISTGITPAYAGKSTPCSYVCHALKGSPPPMRGKALFWKTMAIACRITPAYAGKSLDCSEEFRLRKDHPRLCGEKRLLLA